MIIELKKRWKTEAATAFINNLKQNGRSGNGYEVSVSPFSTVPYSDLLDLRGLAFPERVEWRRISIKNADLKSADLSGAWIESCIFKELSFDNSSLKRITDRKNFFEKCSFDHVSFKEAVLGGLGTRFSGCRFTSADFRGTGFIRPEFDGCLFEDCIFEGVDFGGGSFAWCEFKGAIRGVWFRGEYSISPAIEQFPSTRPNRMNGVSFKEAKLLDVTFSNGCDLSTVIPPSDGKHALLDRWPQRIESVLKLSNTWPDSSRKQGELFYRACRTHAQNQEWYLISEDELVELYGPDAGMRIWDALQMS